MRAALALLLLAGAGLSASAASTAADPQTRVSDMDRKRALFLFDLLVDDDQLAEAEVFLQERYSLGLDTGAWTGRLARLRSAQRRHAESAELYRKLLTDSPEDSGLQIELALQEEAAGRPEESRRILEKTRTLSSNPVVPFHLAELAFDRRSDADGRRWADTALTEIPKEGTPSDRRMRLRLRSRLAYDDALHGDYAAAADRHRQDSQFLFDWASALLRAGAPHEAGEPLALLRDRFPERDLEIRRIEAERWRRIGDSASRRGHLAASLSLYPDDPDFLYSLADDAVHDKEWARAEFAALRLSSSPAYGASAREILLEAREGGRTHAGPRLRLRESSGSRSVETGLTTFGLVRRGWRARADYDRAVITRKAAGTSKTLSGLHAEAARVRPFWEAGFDADLRSGGGTSAASPGAFASYRKTDAFAVSGRTSVRRLWTDSTEAAVAGVLTDDVEAVVRGRPAPRVALSLQGSYNRLSARAGGRGGQTLLAPEAVFVLFHRPLFVAAGYRYAMVDATGDAAFFAALPLLPRSRTHYASLNAGGRWLEGRLKAEGYIFNGHEPERGRQFANGNLLGSGVSVEAAVWKLVLAAGYDVSVEDTVGIGGRSQNVRLSALWRFGTDTLAAAEERAR